MRRDKSHAEVMMALPALYHGGQRNTDKKSDRVAA